MLVTLRLLVEDLANRAMPRHEAASSTACSVGTDNTEIKAGCRMNIGKAMEPRVAIGLEPKNLVIGASSGNTHACMATSIQSPAGISLVSSQQTGFAVSASRCICVKNLVKSGTKRTPRMMASLARSLMLRVKLL